MKKFQSIILSVFFFNIAFAQQKMFTMDDVVLKQRTSLAPDKLMQLQWIINTHVFSFVVKVNGIEKVVQFDASTQKADTVFTADDFQRWFKTLEIDIPVPQRLPFITWLNKNEFRFFYSNTYYLINISKNQASIITKLLPTAEEVTFEEHTLQTAFTIGNNVVVFDTTVWKKMASNAANKINDAIVDSKGVYLTNDGTYGVVNGKTVHRSEFGITNGLFWSPKGNKLAYYKMQENSVTDYELMKFETKPSQFEKIKYPMAGANSHTVRVFVQDFSKKRTFEVQTNANPDQYLTNVSWSPTEDAIYIAVVNRAQNEMKLNQYDARSGVFVKTLFVEKNEKYVEPEHPIQFVKNDPTKFIWMSKRDGFNQLYLYSYNGKLISQLTTAKADVTEFLGFDEQGKTAYYIAATNNGLDRQCFAVDLANAKITPITNTPGIHSVAVSSDGNYFLDTYSNTTTPKKTILKNKTGAELAVLLQAKNPISDYATCGLRLGNLQAADKATVLNYRIVYPPKFDSTQKYPVIVYVYGGPHAQMVTNNWLGGADMWQYYMAQQGYIVFTLDNRGSANRGRDFEQATYRELGTAEREDQLQGVSFLTQQKYVDANRIGVFGWSFGGFMSINLATRTPAFKVAVAGGPVIDWSMYEIMYTERYMDKPIENPDGYNDANLTNYAKDLKANLLIIHGTDDDVVLWQHSLTYIKKCVDEGVQVDYFVYPEHKHNVLGKDRVHLMQKVTDYFKLHL